MIMIQPKPSSQYVAHYTQGSAGRNSNKGYSEQKGTSKITLGPAILFFVERLSSKLRLKMSYCCRKGVQNSVLCWEVAFLRGSLTRGFTAAEFSFEYVAMSLYQYHNRALSGSQSTMWLNLVVIYYHAHAHHYYSLAPRPSSSLP